MVLGGMLPMKKIYTLFILGTLMEKDMHGYLLKSVLNDVLGPFKKISWGVLYPLIHELSELGWIEAIVDESNEKSKKDYQITDKGRLEFNKLMVEPIEFKHLYMMHFKVKLSAIKWISRYDAVNIYANYVQYTTVLINYKKSILAHESNEHVNGLIETEMKELQLARKWSKQMIKKI